ncbi:cupin-like domain-containing protein [Pendulispora brunnea]|uniref:Cupin-like domain-containing protein n=1 Tax=Pendulispora brunnea TaxID=2905690 RepID=A0ABZ2KQL4_9BACT
MKTELSALPFVECERRSNVGRTTFIEEHFLPGRPVIIEGDAHGWRERWTPELLKQRFGDRMIEANTGEFIAVHRKYVPMKLSDVIDNITSGSREYRLRSLEFLDIIPELRHELERDGYFREYFSAPFLMHNLWLAPPGGTSGFHHDFGFENLNFQVCGSKTFYLAHPSNYSNLDPFEFSASPVHPLAPDLERHPRAANVQFVKATLRPGDMMYVPRFWWHFVVAEEVSLNINTFAVQASTARIWASTTGLPIRHRIPLAFTALTQRRRSLDRARMETFNWVAKYGRQLRLPNFMGKRA